MLQLNHISKTYQSESFTQHALDDVSLTFRDSEFVAILGPSGSGKTTMLNILGALDHADSGEIIINGISTSHYSAKDWDTYRNHRVGFIFQSYNLISHQTILSNVELALTLTGVSVSERHRRAKEALAKVGLADHVHKHPSQLSGGQMQRVAIARALVNDPDIVLADEPTGALDSDTGIQIMDLLQEVAHERLVVMVTHNPELAHAYATRIVSVRDGRVVSDSHPLSKEELEIKAESHDGSYAAGLREGGGRVGQSDGSNESEQRDDSNTQKPERHASMSFLTALNLSFNNLMTKKGRTALTAFAGSIGIIGIAAILALSNGVNNYIAKTEEEALSSYPLTITRSSFDIASLMGASMNQSGTDVQSTTDADAIPEYSIMTDMFAKVKSNDLASFKRFLDSGTSGVEPYVNAIEYSYAVTPLIYKHNDSADNSQLVRLNPSYMSETFSNGVAGSAFTGGATRSVFSQLPSNQSLLDSQFSLVEGSWPQAADEAVLVLNKDGGLSDYTLYGIGYYDTTQIDKMTQEALDGQEVEIPQTSHDFTKQKALNLSFDIVSRPRLYHKNEEQNTWTDMSGDADFVRSLLQESLHLRVVGIIQPKTDTSGSSVAGNSVSEGIAYTPALTKQLIQDAQASSIVQDQLNNPDTDVFTGKSFDDLKEEQGRKFDMSSLFSVDETALKKAFSVNESAFEAAFGSGMGDMDMSGLSLDKLNIDPAALQLDPSALESVFGPEAMAKIMANAPKFDPSSIKLDGMSELTPEQLTQLAQSSNKLAAGFAAWAQTHPDEAASKDAVTNYLRSEQAKQILSELSASLGNLSQDIVSRALQAYLSEQFAPYFSAALQQMMQLAAQTMATQLASQIQTQMQAVSLQLGKGLQEAISGQLSNSMSQLSTALQEGFSVDAHAFQNAIHLNMSQDDLTSLLTNYMNAGELSYDANLKKLDYADIDNPDAINIYPTDFEAKQSVLDVIDAYNRQQSDAGKSDATIEYSDLAGVLMSSVTDIVNMISLVLIAFVSISLVVSSIMIGIITYISVLERRKEIGILRAMGASKLNIANVFNAETVIEGFISGVFAIALVYLVSFPVNHLVFTTKGVENIMSLPPHNALILVGISVALTFIAGLVPAMSAARKDPVEALRSE